METPSSKKIDSLREKIKGHIVLPDDSDFNAVRKVVSSRGSNSRFTLCRAKYWPG